MLNPAKWYSRCGDAIRQEFGGDADLFIDILAATSPRKMIAANWRSAMRIYHVWTTQIKPFFSPNGIWSLNAVDNLFHGIFPTHRLNIVRALKRQPLQGNKVRAFAANLKGDLEQVTIDVWVMRYYGYPDTLTTKRYEALAEFIRCEARRQGYKPAEWQAIIWCKAQQQAGRKPQSFLSVPDRKQQYFEFYYQENKNERYYTEQ